MKPLLFTCDKMTHVQKYKRQFRFTHSRLSNNVPCSGPKHEPKTQQGVVIVAGWTYEVQSFSGRKLQRKRRESRVIGGGVWASFRVKLLPQRCSGSKASTGKFPTNGTHQGDIQFSLSLSGHSATHYVKHEGKSIKRITVLCCFL